MEGIHYAILKAVTNEKDLVVIVDSDLKFKEHIDSKGVKGMQMLAINERSSQLLDDRMFKLLFKDIVRAHLEYAASFWSPSSKCSIVHIEWVQRRGMI